VKRLMFLKLAGTAMAELGMPRSGRAKVSESCLRAASELRLAGMNLTELGPCNLGVSERALMLCDFILIRGLESLPLRGGAVNRKGIREIWTSRTAANLSRNSRGATFFRLRWQRRCSPTAQRNWRNQRFRLRPVFPNMRESYASGTGS